MQRHSLLCVVCVFLLDFLYKQYSRPKTYISLSRLTTGDTGDTASNIRVLLNNIYFTIPA